MKTANEARRGPYAIKPATAAGRMRLSLGLTKVEAAKRAGVSLRTYERVEAGDRVLLWTKLKVERALGLPW